MNLREAYNETLNEIYEYCMIQYFRYQEPVAKDILIMFDKLFKKVA